MTGGQPPGAARAVFLDRDGVLVPDLDYPPSPIDISLLAGAADGARALSQAGFLLVVVTNQPAVARGWCTEDDVRAVNLRLGDLLAAAGAPVADIRLCPHHPSANLPEYRADCTCRKPRPGMLRAAAAHLAIDLGRSFMVGDRPSDVQAGSAAGCRTVQVRTGRHLDPPIQSSETPVVRPPDHACPDLLAASAWILAESA